MFVTFVQEITTFDVHVFYKIIMRKMYHSSRLLRHPTRFRKLGYVLLDDVTQVELEIVCTLRIANAKYSNFTCLANLDPCIPLLHINIGENILTFTGSK